MSINIKIGVFGMLFNDKKQILLCHRRDYDMWDIPGGGLEKGESPWKGVIREVKEESLLALTQASEAEFARMKTEAEHQENKILNESIPVLKAKIKKLETPPSSGFFMNPLKNKSCLTSKFWAMRCFYADGICRRHYGDDLKAYQGQALYAAGDGIVIKVQPSCSHRYIVIQHPDGNLASIYMHLSEIFVGEGSTVQRGELIGKTGGTIGTCGAGTSTGPHLHFEVRDLSKSCGADCRYWAELGMPVDPKKYADLGGSCY